MREILFRGKAINRIKGREYRTNYKNGDWVYGLVTQMHDERFGFPAEAEMTNTDGVLGIEVDYKTIGQYTGLTDCKGNKIFEGDIISVEYEYESYSGTSVFYEYYEVFFHEKYHCWYTRHSTIKTEYWLYGFNNRCEVIGNIYDNPELLEATK